ncbi:hypothetical protein ACFZDK_28195 [Streptomyces sp. NPDC007901]|uniref:hypothetical protein n=1 Tax=Streptomyces sp. NPDC007901 TaxID=3364785 RepID=UPI0036E3CA21
MRRTVRALSVAVLAGAACGAAGTAAARPGTTVTVSVTCGDRAEVYTEGGTTSAAGRNPASAPDGACPAAGGEQPQQPWTAPFTVAGGDDAGALPPGVGGDVPPGLDGAVPPGDGGGTAPRGDAGTAPRGDGGVPPRGDEGTGAHFGDDGTASHGDDGTVSHGDDGTASHGDGGTASHGDGGTGGHRDDGTASHGDDGTASHGDDGTVPWKNDERPCAAEGQQQKSCGGDEQECDGARGGGDTSCAPPGVQHGVEAGEGGAFTESVPALAAGGVLIAAACGGAAYRLWGGRFRADG